MPRCDHLSFASRSACLARNIVKLTNVGGFDNIYDFVKNKIEKYKIREKNMESLFALMFSEEENIMAEISDGYRIKRFSYGQIKADILKIAPTLASRLSDVPQGSMVGVYMSNSINWIKVFWGVIVCGYRPLLLNTSFSDSILEDILKKQGVGAVISDGKKFCVPTFLADDVLTFSDETLEARTFGTEVVFMSSGTTENVKLCAYNGENFFYQICDSYNIIKQCPSIATHYKGELKQLALLPFYHVFGFIAVYLWFGFFSRTLVFLKDLNPATIQNTIKKHNVTHFFAVPSVFERVHRVAVSKIQARDKKSYKKFSRALKISNSLGTLNVRFAKLFLKEVRENLFGDSVSFLISGGGGIDTETLKFFNGIGYHLANGFGMTELGITSFEKSASPKQLAKGSIGSTFEFTEYKVESDGRLFAKGRTRAARIIVNGEAVESDYDEWFDTKDLVRVEDGRYYHLGRADDLVIGANGENLNPTLIEPLLTVDFCSGVCLIADKDNQPTLIASVQNCFSVSRLSGIFASLERAVSDANLDAVIKRIVITSDPLMEAGEFKISRKRIRRKYIGGELSIVERAGADEHIEAVSSELEKEIIEVFASVLEIDSSKISATDHFFHDLAGSSLDYFMLLDVIRSKYSVEINEAASEKLYTARDFCEFIKTTV